MDIKLVKTNVRGKTQVWQAKVEGTTVTYCWGQEGGTLSTKVDTYTKGHQKRSAEEQAAFEARSTAKKKMKDGYIDPEASSNDLDQIPLPMLAQDMNKLDMDKLKKISTSIFMQPKLDGVRCIINTKTLDMWSRSRTRFSGLDHIAKAVGSAFQDDPEEHWLDGELYNHDLTFQEITSLVRRTKNHSADAKIVQYHVFDIIQDAPFAYRNQKLQFLAQHLETVSQGKVRVVKTVAATLDDVSRIHADFTKEGYEGSMIRMDTTTGYEKDKRSRTLVKVKDFLQEEYKVTGFLGREFEDTLASVVCGLPDGREFHATPSVTDDQKLHIWRNQDFYKGQLASVKFFEKTDGGIPRFPILVGFRDTRDT